MVCGLNHEVKNEASGVRAVSHTADTVIFLTLGSPQEPELSCIPLIASDGELCYAERWRG